VFKVKNLIILINILIILLVIELFFTFILGFKSKTELNTCERIYDKKNDFHHYSSNCEIIIKNWEQDNFVTYQINSEGRRDLANLKNNSKNIVIGDGDIDSPIMLIGETPGEEEDISGSSFKGEIGKLLNKMLLAIKIKREKIYTTYSINFRPPKDRKPTTQEIKRYSVFLKDHISIIDPKIIILMGSTAMEAVTGSNEKISNERGKWKEIILKNKSILLMVTFSPSYLLRFPENKKYSWEDLKKIRKKIEDLNIEI